PAAPAASVMIFCMHLFSSSETAAIFLASSSLALPSLSPLAWVQLRMSSLTLSAHPLSLHAHMRSLNSVYLATRSPPPFFLQPKEASATAARNAIEIFCIDELRSLISGVRRL